MSAIKNKKQSKTILVVNPIKWSKEQLDKRLNSLRLKKLLYLDRDQDLVFIDNDIIIGMYKVRLCFSFLDRFSSTKQLKASKFKIQIFELSNFGEKEIIAHDDPRFKHYLNASNNLKYKSSIENLSNIVYACAKLDSLKLFL